MRTWKQVKKDWLKDKEVAREYKRLKPRYELISQLIEARKKDGLTQQQLARKMGTKQSSIARVESGSINPSLAFLEKLTSSLGKKLVIQIK